MKLVNRHTIAIALLLAALVFMGGRYEQERTQRKKLEQERAYFHNTLVDYYAQNESLKDQLHAQKEAREAEQVAYTEGMKQIAKYSIRHASRDMAFRTPQEIRELRPRAPR